MSSTRQLVFILILCLFSNASSNKAATRATKPGDPPIWLGSVMSSEQEAMPEGLKIIERKFMKNHTVGMNAKTKMLEALKNRQWWEVSQQYTIANWNLPNNESDNLRDAINRVLGGWMANNQLGLDISTLGFGWRREYGAQRIAFHDRRASVLNQLRSGEDLSLEVIKERLASPSLKDPRPECEKMKDVAGIMAETFRWKEAKAAIKQACASLSVEDRGRLLGYLSMGIKYEMPVDKAETVRAVIKKLPKAAQTNRQVTEWSAGMLSLYKNLHEKFTGTEPQIEPFDVAKSRFRFKADPAIMHHEQMSEVLERANRKDYVHLLPVIRKAFEQKRRNPLEAFHFLANLLCEYYKKDGDMWSSWLWFQEAMKVSKGPVEDRWMHTLEDKIRNDTAQQSRMLLRVKDDKPEAAGVFERLEKELDAWMEISEA